ncbi:MAG: helix-turn-helix transcriptional regulator [Eubacterium sp.]|nr:helix-turn-helix transcriptional regulator [Eubacterium sp.]
MSVGENIKKMRERRNLTQHELSEKVGITQSMLCQIEAGLKFPSFPVAVQIAKALNCTTDELAQ